MERILLLAAFPLLALTAPAQPVPSSCDAPPEVAALYQDDAFVLALRKIHAQDLPEQDSVTIPTAHVDTMLHALIAVYNATDLPARDTVVDLLHIHAWPMYLLDQVMVAADSTLPWMQQLRLGNIPTGDAAVDALLAQYGMSIHQYSNWYGLQPWHLVILSTDAACNVEALAGRFAELPGVAFAEPNHIAGDGDDIEATIHADGVGLRYSHGWGDCPSGCIMRRFWEIRVRWDCSVEYLGSHGSPLDWIVGLGEAGRAAASVAPNPFTDRIAVCGMQGPLRYAVMDASGRAVRQGTAGGAAIDGLGGLRPGPYLLTVSGAQGTRRFKLLRE